MAVIKLYSGYKLPETLVCVICDVKLTLDKATAGPLDGERQQMFACVSHFSEVEKLINGWADFFIAEQRRRMERELRGRGLIPMEVGENAWTDT
jgi:hypothetical protein